MNTIPIGSYRPVQKIYPLSLLAQFISRATTGCLQLSSGGSSWFVHLEQGKLVYASDVVDPFGRLDRHLRRMSVQAPSLISAVRVQVRLMFEMPTAEHFTQHSDYRAICWLVEQQHLTPDQAVTLIEALAKEVIEAFLPIQTGSYELIEHDLLADFPKFCQLDLRSLVEGCQNQIRRRQTATPSPAVPPRFITSPSPVPASKPQAAGNSINSLLGQRTESQQSQNQQARSQQSQNQQAQSQQSRSQFSPVQPTQSQQAPPLSTSKTYTIACIDDSPTVLQAINAFLDDKSFSVVLISDPIKALMQIIRSKPDLILLDVTMPNLDGYELCSLLRKHPSFRNTPIIMVTGNTGFIDRAKAKLVGASGYLTKPFTQSDLIKIVFKHLS
ncbi:MAG: response regulator [Cyanobacteria bacterium RM1_2_2]|nr:response regulator [Cyanobacteria bacterium RM1_2_2]